MQSGFTPLHLAAHYNGVDVGQLLIEHGAIVDIKAKVKYIICLIKINLLKELVHDYYCSLYCG